MKWTPLEKQGAKIENLEEYVKDDGFDIPRLIDDDFFRAIKLLFNERLYVSSDKLLVSCIDSIAFIEFGDIPGNFIKWLETYARLDPVGIAAVSTSGIPQRNPSHDQSEFQSRPEGKGKGLILSVGDVDSAPALDNPSWKRLDFKQLLLAITATSGWVESYNKDRNKVFEFVARYDLTISDSRRW